MSDISNMLFKIQTGESNLAGGLLPLVYHQLRKLAVARLVLEKPGQTLQATAIVHQAYLRLCQNEENPNAGDGIHWGGRGSGSGPRLSE